MTTYKFFETESKSRDLDEKHSKLQGFESLTCDIGLIFEDTPPYTKLIAIVRNGVNNAYGDTVTTLQADQWYHLAMVYNGSGIDNASRLKLYINGVNESLTWVGTIPSTTCASNTGDFRIGRYDDKLGTNSFFNGSIFKSIPLNA